MHRVLVIQCCIAATDGGNLFVPSEGDTSGYFEENLYERVSCFFLMESS